VELASGPPDRVINLAGTMDADLPFDVPTLDMPTRPALNGAMSIHAASNRFC